MELTSLVKEICETAVSLAVLAYPTVKILGALFGNSFITKFGDKIAELSTTKYKTKIEETVRQSFRAELETLKADLTKKNKTYEINYSKFQQKRFDVVVELYNKLAIMTGLASHFTNPFIPGVNEKVTFKKRAKSYNDAATEFNNYLILNKLFLDDDFFNKLFEKHKEINLICKQYEICFNRLHLSGFSEEEKLKLEQELIDISGKMPHQLTEIENYLRTLLYPKE